jgi:hypothetical protein
MSNGTSDTTGATAISSVIIPDSNVAQEATESTNGSVRDATAKENFISTPTHVGKRPSWLVDSLGPLGKST